MSKIYKVSELGDILIYQNEKGDTEENSTCKEFLQVQTESTRQINDIKAGKK